MSLDEQESMQWTAPANFLLGSMIQNAAGYHAPNPFPPSTGDLYHYAENGMSYNDNFNITYPPQYSSSSCPRSYTGIDLTGLPNDIDMTDSYPPTAYHIEPPKHHDAMDLSDHEISGQLMQLSNDYDHHQYGSHVKAEDLNDYQSPYSDLTRVSTPHDDSSLHLHDLIAGEGGIIDKEQPYAQLIYQALLNAPNKTMILRDIYEWFKNNTDKASASETKGWQNSIRHNLSMNGAFEKVDQPGEESRKGFMWRLTDEAIRGGVKSTTRYRSKQPNKRGHRTQQPQPQRQASGAKGGQAARRSARMKRSGRMQDTYRNDQYISRSVPAAFDPSYHGPDSSISYPPSPYYGSEVDFGYASRNDDFGSVPVLGHAHLNLFSPARSYTGSPISQGIPITDTAYVLDQSPTESLFTNSPSPSTDEPRTPVDQGWQEDVGMGPPCVFDDQHGYRPYAG
ncbi:hypothetical protein AA0119_g10232 [Alternaria tenuissima]|uniref:Fork-head domain-containing protein n=1 Tax=Alternaria tenuissima TaxID=119927 RepID=A0ABY0FXK0_9PLEO|nr:hypothetical protein AA0119_g10232 [Alternaria tenuissima]RYO05905.1 hypothetical protein AA0121_g12265 [Alternaria tenuissima]RYO68385.1 hypothetical protein AA0116_g1113 [Alternaria tenuissima]